MDSIRFVLFFCLCVGWRYNGSLCVCVCETDQCVCVMCVCSSLRLIQPDMSPIDPSPVLNRIYFAKELFPPISPFSHGNQAKIILCCEVFPYALLLYYYTLRIPLHRVVVVLWLVPLHRVVVVIYSTTPCCCCEWLRFRAIMLCRVEGSTTLNSEQLDLELGLELRIFYGFIHLGLLGQIKAETSTGGLRADIYKIQ